MVLLHQVMWKTSVLTQSEACQYREAHRHESVSRVRQKLQEWDGIGGAQRVHEGLQQKPVHPPCSKPLTDLHSMQ